MPVIFIAHTVLCERYFGISPDTPESSIFVGLSWLRRLPASNGEQGVAANGRQRSVQNSCLVPPVVGLTQGFKVGEDTIVHCIVVGKCSLPPQESGFGTGCLHFGLIALLRCPHA